MAGKNWTVEKNTNYSPPWVLRFDPTPGGKKNADGTTTFSLSFPALQATDWVADPETALEPIAKALNRDGIFVEITEALKACARILPRYATKGKTTADDEECDAVLETVNELIAKAEAWS